MSMTDKRDQIIERLTTLNDAVGKQNSFMRIFITGIIWGVGFVIGSAVLATLILGFLLPVFENIEWVRNLYIRGAALLGK